MDSNFPHISVDRFAVTLRVCSVRIDAGLKRPLIRELTRPGRITRKEYRAYQKRKAGDQENLTQSTTSLVLFDRLSILKCSFFLRTMRHESTRRGTNVQPRTVRVSGWIAFPRLIGELGPIWVN